MINGIEVLSTLSKAVVGGFRIGNGWRGIPCSSGRSSRGRGKGAPEILLDLLQTPGVGI